jgi:hypothetical protein
MKESVLLLSLGVLPLQLSAALTPDELQKIEDFRSINGFSIARLLHNLVGDPDTGTLHLAVSGNGPLSGDFWDPIRDQMRPLYENFLADDPFSLGMKLGAVNYANYRMGAFPVPFIPRDGTRPFDIRFIGWTPLNPQQLAQQQALKRAFITYNDRFCSAGNLAALEDFSACIFTACVENLPDIDSKLDQLYEHFKYAHGCYCQSRIPDGNSLAFALLFLTFERTVQGWRDIAIQDHSGDFPPQVLAIFNLSQIISSLVRFLRENPLVTLLGQAVNSDERDPAKIQETRSKISTYEVLEGELIEWLKTLDNSLFDAMR